MPQQRQQGLRAMSLFFRGRRSRPRFLSVPVLSILLVSMHWRSAVLRYGATVPNGRFSLSNLAM